ncbi:Uncharacterized protein BP5553_05770 [Venustampulla echinocandica]|uniref:Cytochrome P450 n=1 Tax=Venustampulla echinocandica TaxID=2656787 RepID=A0A370TLM2_9HELO|nr:Uncharacterized protein BP5553_05770 [Venustampulla echinocandica]RDL36418.1 Uncharacterized protein BP5553_05770 [Venustampulla echinocandica]
MGGELLGRIDIPKATAATILIVFLGAAVRRRYYSPLSDIPGPFFASFSVIWQLWHIIKCHTEAAMREMATGLTRQLAGKFVRLSHKEVSISDPAAVREVLQSQMDKANWYKVFSMPDSRYENTMSETSYKEMNRRTRNVAAGYSLSNVIKGEPYIDKALGLFQTQLDRRVASGSSIELDKWVNYLAFDVVGESTFSKSFGFLEAGHDIGNSISNQYKLRLYIALIGHFSWAHDYLLANPLIGHFNLQPSMHVFDTSMAAVKKRSESVETRNDMIELWQQQYRNHPDRMDEKEILAAAVANGSADVDIFKMGAGADTVSCILQAFCYYLLRDTESLKLVREEIDNASLSPIPSYEETRELPVLSACIKESYRIHTPVGFNLPRVSPSPDGVTVCGRYFAPGVILSVSPWVIHRQQSVFGSDAESYNAQRWLGDKDRAIQMEKYMIAFGTGYGSCPGRSLAHMEILKTTALLIRDYEWEQVTKGQVWTFETYFTSIPYNWPVKMRRRRKFNA